MRRHEAAVWVMAIGLLAMVVVPAARAESAAAGVAGELKLRNGDRLTGRIEGMDTRDRMLILRHASVREPIAVALEALNEFRVATDTASAVAAPDPWGFELTNGDIIRGALHALDAEAFHVDTPFMGRVSIVRAMVRSASHSVAGGRVYEGPGDAEGWTVGQGAPHFEDGAVTLTSGAFVVREIAMMPRRARIDVELSWASPGQSQILIFGDGPNPRDGMQSAYSVLLRNHTRLELNRHIPRQGVQRIGHADLQGLEARGQVYSARFTLLVDLDRAWLQARVDDRPVGEWSDPHPFVGDGKHLAFIDPQGSGFTVHRIRIAEWAGRIEAAVGDTPGVTIRLANGDTLTGRWKSARDGEARVETAFGPLDIPMDRLADIAFTGAPAHARRNRGDVRLHLRDGTIVTIDVSSLSDGAFVGASENVGSARVPIDSVTRIEWNLYPADTGDRRGAS